MIEQRVEDLYFKHGNIKYVRNLHAIGTIGSGVCAAGLVVLSATSPSAVSIGGACTNTTLCALNARQWYKRQKELRQVRSEAATLGLKLK